MILLSCIFESTVSIHMHILFQKIKKCSDFFTCASCMFCAGMQSFYFSESQDAMVLQTYHGKYTQQKKLRKLCLRALTKGLKHLKTFEFHNSIM